MNQPKHLLLIEDDATLAASLCKVLESDGHCVDHEVSGDRGARRAIEGDYDLVLTDLKLPGLSGLELVDTLRESRPRLPVILVTAHGTADTAIEATKRGAFDYLLKPFDMDEFLGLVGRALDQVATKAQEPPTDRAADDASDFIVGRSRAMQDVFKAIGRVAPQSVTVLISGESGTGKELVARAIARHSPRRDGPFIAINCAAIPDTLLESELFGHEKGAFTGAHARRIGCFEQASGGTLFLDEIGDISPATQVRLLRVLQEGCIQRVGGKDIVPIDARILLATHQDLQVAVESGRFREDLYYRVSVVNLRIPALRERPEDVPLLVDHFGKSYARKLDTSYEGFASRALERLCRHDWPGNVRELENVTRRLLLGAKGFPITEALVEEALDGRPVRKQEGEAVALDALARVCLQRASRDSATKAHAEFIEVAETALLQQAMELARGNQSLASRWLGVSRLTLREKLRRYGLHPSDENAE